MDSSDVYSSMTMMTEWIIISLFVAVTIYILFKTWTTTQPSSSPFPVKAMAILGSGGHTGELLGILETLNNNTALLLFTPRIYVASDPLSITRARDKEEQWGGGGGDDHNNYSENVEYCEVVRIRNVGELFLMAFFRLPVVIAQSVAVVLRHRPTMILCNGPGMCFPICIVAKMFNILRITNSKIFFIESFCRTEGLSMTGKLMVYAADEFVVQWKSLYEHCVEKYPERRFEYFGRLQ